MKRFKTGCSIRDSFYNEIFHVRSQKKNSDSITFNQAGVQVNFLFQFPRIFDCSVNVQFVLLVLLTVFSHAGQSQRRAAICTSVIILQKSVRRHRCTLHSLTLVNGLTCFPRHGYIIPLLLRNSYIEKPNITFCPTQKLNPEPWGPSPTPRP